MKKRGRPPIGIDGKRASAKVEIRVTPYEKALITQAADLMTQGDSTAGTATFWRQMILDMSKTVLGLSDGSKTLNFGDDKHEETTTT